MKLIDICPNKFNINYVYFNEPIQNTIITESRFIRILYSTPDIIFNGIHIILPLKLTNIDRQYNKNIVYYDVNNNIDLINDIINIEKQVLEKYISNNKEYTYNLKNQLENGSFKLYPEVNDKKKIFDIVLKISGLWENNNNYGLTYKFISVSRDQ